MKLHEKHSTLGLVVRKVSFKYSPEISRHWLDNNPVHTQLMNSLTLCFPDFEKFLIQSVQAVEMQKLSLDLQKQGQAFIVQEGMHKHFHSRFFDILRNQGYHFDWFLKTLRLTLNIIRIGFGKRISLSISSSGEHITATQSDFFLKSKWLENGDPTMKRLFKWHFAEEIEHKSVIFDIERALGNNYFHRVVGLAISHVLIPGFILLGLLVLLYQDGILFQRKTIALLFKEYFSTDGFTWRIWTAALDYLRPSFHPWEHDNRIIAEDALRESFTEPFA